MTSKKVPHVGGQLARPFQLRGVEISNWEVYLGPFSHRK